MAAILVSPIKNIIEVLRACHPDYVRLMAYRKLRQLSCPFLHSEEDNFYIRVQ